jgi:hypothetical protein
MVSYVFFIGGKGRINYEEIGKLWEGILEFEDLKI